ncbi:MAG: minor capsid protein [Clostridia bacterium]|nr:minor capsid protein [Clostridia bacterium]
MAEMKHYLSYSVVKGNVEVKVDLSRIAENYEAAQQWLGDRVLEDCKSFMPMQTGVLQQRSYVESNGSQVVFPGPYARFLYGGKVMIDPETGSPWARKGAKKVLTDRPLTFSNPQATDHWFDAAKAQYGETWTDGVKKILTGGKS